MINTGLAGEYIVRKQKVLMENGAPKLDRNGNQIPIGDSWVEAKFSNLITNQGLNFMGQSTESNATAISRLTVSTSTTIPAYTDTAILGEIGSVRLENADSLHELNNSVKPYFISRKKVFRIDAGVGTGNITKLYVGNHERSILWSVALIKDSLGNPTTITKLPDEILDVTYILKNYLLSDDITSKVIISGVEYNTTTRLYYLNSYWGEAVMYANSSIRTARTSNLNIANINDQISSQEAVSVDQLTDYVQDSFERVYQVSLSLTQGNTGVRTLVVQGINSGYQIRFGSVASDAPIPKTADYKLIMPPVTIKWGRYVAT